MKLIRYLIIVLSVILFTGCSCEKRLQRLRVHCPECVTTEIVSDTVIIPEYQYDTTFVMRRPTDTVVVLQDRVRIEVIRELDTFYLKTVIPADTIVQTVEVEKLIYPPDNNESLLDRLKKVLVTISLMLSAALVGYIAGKIWR